jgi:hypothetical protein
VRCSLLADIDARFHSNTATEDEARKREVIADILGISGSHGSPAADVKATELEHVEVTTTRGEK